MPRIDYEHDYGCEADDIDLGGLSYELEIFGDAGGFYFENGEAIPQELHAELKAAAEAFGRDPSDCVVDVTFILNADGDYLDARYVDITLDREIDAKLVKEWERLLQWSVWEPR